MQSKRQSLIEAITNIIVGYSINFTANMLVLPRFGFNVTIRQNICIGVIFTGISLVRSYLLRRFYNNRHK